MDFYEEASLVMVPSGYKDQKVYSSVPDDGSGDLTFSRASNATRVNSEGLVEKVRTNLVLQSNQFDTTWYNSNTTETSGQSGYDGTNDAWKLTKSASSAYIRQDLTDSGVFTFSVYAKASTDAGDSDGIYMLIDGSPDSWATFDLNNGTTSLGAGASVGSKIEEIGSGWYKCSITGSGGVLNVRIYPTAEDGTYADTTGAVFIQDAQLETGDIATDYIETTTAAVSVGPVSGLPRLNYDAVNPTSASLLLEPQRTNLLQYSEQMDNAAWVKNNATITANSVVSPDGYTNADTYTATGGGNYISGGATSTGSNTITYSVFAKAGTQNVFRIREAFYFGSSTIFDLSTGTVTSGTGTITSYANGWYRCTHTQAYGAGQTNVSVIFDTTASSGTLYLYGAQFEVGAYATSYIPTLSSAVTRVADAASKTGVASLIGQTEGTLFVDAYFDGVNQALSRMGLFVRTTGSNTGYAFLNFYVGKLNCALRVGGVTMFDSFQTGLLPAGRYKIAMGYKSGDTAIYMNGNQVATDTDTFGTTGYTEAYVGCSSSGVQLGDGINQALLFTQRLSNDDLAILTSL